MDHNALNMSLPSTSVCVTCMSDRYDTLLSRAQYGDEVFDRD